MHRTNHCRLGALLAAFLLLPGPSSAGVLTGLFCKDCPPSQYTPLHYWTAGLYRLYNCKHGPHVNQYPPDRQPYVTPGYEIIRYPCPQGDPPSLLLQRDRGR